MSVLVAVLLAFTFLMSIPPAGAAPFTGGVSPTIYGLRADLNGSGTVNGADDSNAFYGDTSIIDGMLDCDAWGTCLPYPTTGPRATVRSRRPTTARSSASTERPAASRSGWLTACSRPPTERRSRTGRSLPMTYNATTPDDPSVPDSDFGWSTIGGRVDSNGNGAIDGDDGTFGLIGNTVDVGLGDPTDGADVLASCIGIAICFARHTPDRVLIGMSIDGLVDLNSDGLITLADTCSHCFFGRDLASGFVDLPGGGGGGGGGGGTPPPTPPPTVVTHERNTPLTLEQHLVATGIVDRHGRKHGMRGQRAGADPATHLRPLAMGEVHHDGRERRVPDPPPRSRRKVPRLGSPDDACVRRHLRAHDIAARLAPPLGLGDRRENRPSREGPVLFAEASGVEGRVTCPA